MSERVEQYRAAVPYLLHWYDYNARVLPWRQSPTPYHVWVSEIMLQQTRVEAVRAYYERFLAELPEVSDLATADEEHLLKLWEGLGYYSRVRNMKRAAQVICEDYGGVIPQERDVLMTLPGIGGYTAGAIASIAYRKPASAVDGNVLRVMSRLTGSREDISKEAVKRQMTHDLDAVMPGERSGELNQAIMDIGATVCIPNGEPHCIDCPLVHLCKAFAEESTAEIPVKGVKAGRRIEKRTVLLIRQEERTLLRKRPDKGLLAGLWEFPGIDGWASEETVREKLQELLGDTVMIDRVCAGTDAKHIFSHVEWHMKSVIIDVKGAVVPEGCVFATADELRSRYSMPGAFAAYRTIVTKEER